MNILVKDILRDNLIICKGGLVFEQPSHGKQMAEFFEGFHVFYDLVEEYMENLGSGNDWLYL